MALPVVGGSDGAWGTTLTNFLGGADGAGVPTIPNNRIPYLAGGNHTSSANLTFDGTTLTVNSVVITAGNDIRPTSNSTTAINIANAAGTDFVSFDTTNLRVGINLVPAERLDVGGNIRVEGATNPYYRLNKTNATAREWYIQALVDAVILGSGAATGLSIDPSDRASLGSANPATGGGPSLSLLQGTQPTGIVANTAGIWVQDVAGTAELMGFDEPGNDIQLTAHPSDFLNTRAKSTVAWGYNWTNRYEGKRYLVDMGQLIDFIEAQAALQGKSFVVIEDLPPEKRADWDADQEARRVSRDGEIAAVQFRVAELNDRIAKEADQRKRAELTKLRDAIKSPGAYVKKTLPKWMRDRGVVSAIA